MSRHSPGAGRTVPPPRAARPGPAVAELRIDFAACDGHGSCAELLPTLLATDDWGFPVVRGGGRRVAVPRDQLAAARDAERSCPVLALRLTLNDRG